MNADYKKNLKIAEALIFASEKAINIKEIKTKLPDIKDIKKLLIDLQKQYDRKGINLKESNNYWYFETATDIAEYLKEHKVIKKNYLKQQWRHFLLLLISILSLSRRLKKFAEYQRMLAFLKYFSIMNGLSQKAGKKCLVDLYCGILQQNF